MQADMNALSILYDIIYYTIYTLLSALYDH